MAAFSVGNRLLYATLQSGDVRGVIEALDSDADGPFIRFRVTQKGHKVYRRGDTFPVWLGTANLRKI